MAQVHVMERDWWTKAWCGGRGRPVKRDARLVAWLLELDQSMERFADSLFFKFWHYE